MPAIGMGMTYVLPDVLDGFRADGRKLLDAAREEGRKAGVDCDAELFELQGAADDVPGCLLSCARRYGAELVVLGTHGRRGVARAMLGSVAEGFVRIAECPVLLVPRRVAP
jgi:nucleotide-binding universal stress UspA family protein